MVSSRARRSLARLSRRDQQLSRQSRTHLCAAIRRQVCDGHRCSRLRCSRRRVTALVMSRPTIDAIRRFDSRHSFAQLIYGACKLVSAGLPSLRDVARLTQRDTLVPVLEPRADDSSGWLRRLLLRRRLLWEESLWLTEVRSLGWQWRRSILCTARGGRWPRRAHQVCSIGLLALKDQRVTSTRQLHLGL